MNSAKLLDCTLRDGAYIVDKYFGDDVILGVIDGLINAGVDIIEIGFLQNDGLGAGKPVFLNANDAEKYIPKNRGNSAFSVLADFSRYSIDNLGKNNGQSFDIVRACFFKHERYDAMDFLRGIKARGYKLFVQPVDILGYSDSELLELIEMVNEVEPYCFSIVDTFGSMYLEDLQHIYSLIEFNLFPQCHIGFHSHNNMQMSSALSQEFLRMSFNHRNAIVDATISGMGRGAGNTPTELIAQYMVSKLKYHYDIDSLLDLIDNYIDPLRIKTEWGYNTHMFLAGVYSAHVNNIAYLKDKNSIRSRDIRFILNRVGTVARKRYHYDLLEKAYIDYMKSDIDDKDDMEKLKTVLYGRAVAIIAPGKTAMQQSAAINDFVRCNSALVVSINFEPLFIKPDYIYMSNVRRYQTFLHKKKKNSDAKRILTSNICSSKSDGSYLISFCRLIKCGWEYADNSTILLLRLLDQLGVAKVGIAGLDGYSFKAGQSNHYAEESLEIPVGEEVALKINNEISEMLQDFLATKQSELDLSFITTSRFEEVLKN